jgi:hypothetical protein
MYPYLHEAKSIAGVGGDNLAVMEDTALRIAVPPAGVAGMFKHCQVRGEKREAIPHRHLQANMTIIYRQGCSKRSLSADAGMGRSLT